jgi:uncharacterized membrane protein YgcG
MLVAVDALTEKLGVALMTSKRQQDWEEGIVHLINNVFPIATCIVADRDVSISGKAFQSRMKREHDIDFFHLRVRSKSYKSEIQIRQLKRKLSIALGMNKRGDNRWIDKVPAVVAHHNEQFVTGTKIRRKDAVKGNMMELIAQKYKTPEFGVYFNNSVMTAFSAKMRRKLGFLYEPGQKVLLSRAATYEAGSGKAGHFDKVSVEGTFDRKVHEIKSAELRYSSNHTLLLTYSLKDVAGKYYQSELILARAFLNRKKKEEEERGGGGEGGAGGRGGGGGGGGGVRDQAEFVRTTRAAAKRRKRRKRKAT